MTLARSADVSLVTVTSPSLTDLIPSSDSSSVVFPKPDMSANSTHISAIVFSNWSGISSSSTFK